MAEPNYAVHSLALAANTFTTILAWHTLSSVKAETDFLTIFTRWKARATLVAAAAIGCYRSGSITFATILLQSF